MEELETVKNVVLHMPGPAMLIQDYGIVFWNDAAVALLTRTGENLTTQLPSSLKLPPQGGAAFSEYVYDGVRYAVTAWDIGPAVIMTLQKEDKSENLSALNMLANSFRQPISGIYACARILLERVEKLADPQTEEYSAALVKNMYQLIWLMGNVEALQQFAGPEGIPPNRLLDIAQLLRELVEESKPYVAALKRTILYEGPNKPVMTLIHPNRIRHALLNLMANSLKYTHAGGTIRVKLAQAGKTLAISVLDDGMGISPERMQQISDAYSNFSGREFSPEGAGVGLPLVRSVAQLHGGTMMMESRVDQGTTVTMTLIACAKYPETLRALANKPVREEYLQPKVAFSTLLPNECYMFEDLQPFLAQ